MNCPDTALVTGGAGFIGSELTAQLVATGWRVIVLDNLSTGRLDNLEGLAHERVDVVRGDVREPECLVPLLRHASTVFHLACLNIRRSLYAPRESHEVNAAGTLTVLEAARDAGVRRFVYVSSSEVYGTAKHVPMTEDHPPHPANAYGASKLAGEAYARAFHATYGLPVVIARPFNAYGPRAHHEGDSGEVIPKFLLRALTARPLIIFGDGTQTRDFTYVADTARGILRAACTDAAIGQTINLGSGAECAITELARRIATVAGCPEPLLEYQAPRPGDVTRQCADIGRARRLLGFEPQIPLDEGLRRLLAWYESRGIAPEVLLEHEVVRNWECGAVDARRRVREA